MELRTFASLEAQIRQETDTEDEDFVEPSEMKQIINDAIDIAEAKIHGLRREDDYFLEKAVFNIVEGTADVALPSNIYAWKIKSIIYKRATRIYEIKRLRGKNRFIDSVDANLYPTETAILSWLPYGGANTTGDGRRVRLFPTPQETIAGEIWYIRNMNKYGSDSSEVCDLPEFYRFIIDYGKVRVAEKEAGNPMLAKWQENFDRSMQNMIETLSEMTDDEDNEIPPDFSFYEEAT